MDRGRRSPSLDNKKRGVFSYKNTKPSRPVKVELPGRYGIIGGWCVGYPLTVPTQKQASVVSAERGYRTNVKEDL